MAGRAAAIVALLAAAVAVGFVAASVMGRGSRPAVGVPGEAGADGVRIAFYSQGSGESVVLLASLARSVSDFNELAEALSLEGFRTLAVESRGVGGSRGGGPLARPSLHDLASDVAAVLDASGVGKDEPVHVVGHAFGNRVARSFAADHRPRVRSVTLIAAGGRAPIPPRIERALLASMLSFLPGSLREPELRLAFFASGSAIPDHWRKGWWLWGGLAQIHAARAARSSEFWGAGGAPMLVLQGEQDTIAPPEDAGLALAAEFPDRVTLVSIPGAGHALLPEQPARIAEAIVPFLRRHGSGRDRTPLPRRPLRAR